MTVGSQVKQTIASLKNAQATLKIYSIQSQSEETRRVFNEALSTTGEIISGMEARLKVLEFEEPQYKSR
ncbi:MAG TPA: hypothetical protein DDW50_15575 [Firmicutes bacterium]|nr:hypothetical protein [Bacillota bacterium]